MIIELRDRIQQVDLFDRRAVRRHHLRLLAQQPLHLQFLLQLLPKFVLLLLLLDEELLGMFELSEVLILELLVELL